LVDADGNATGVTAEIFDSSGTRTPDSALASTKISTGLYEVALTPAMTSILDTYSVTWSFTKTSVVNKFYSQFQTVGGFLFSVGELRAFDAALDATTYPIDVVEKARAAAEERLEQLCSVAFVPRGRRYITDGDGDTVLRVPDVELRSVVSASISDGTTTTALTADELADLKIDPAGIVTRWSLGSWDSGVRNVTVLYEYGYSQPPEPVKRAAMALARNNLVGLSLFDRARSEAVEGGILSFTLAGRDGPTGIPEVDAVIAQFGRSVYAF
jgi:hypothetical protein